MNSDPRVAWLTQHAVSLRSIEPDDTDFSDLEPFAEVLKGIRVVLLGEATHGDGSSFLAKTRLVKWLHQELGFNALAWESGFYDCHVAWQSIKTKPAREAFREGVFGVWSDSAEVMPLVDYLGAQIHTVRPLELLGFDSQLSGSASETQLVTDLTHLRDAVGANVSEDDWKVYASQLERLARHRWYEQKPSLETWEIMGRVHAKLRDDLERHSEFPDWEFWRQNLCSLEMGMRNQWLMDDAEPGWDYVNRRDAQMANNLLWHLENNTERKFIVWAASFHNARRIWQVGTVEGISVYNGVKPMGDYLFEVLGNQTYALGITSDTGEVARCYDEKPDVLEVTQPGDLEWLFSEAQLEIAILNCRDLPDDHFLRQTSAAKCFAQSRMVGKWSAVQDGILFTKRVTRSHHA
jgi:erythromycin esterase